MCLSASHVKSECMVLYPLMFTLAYCVPLSGILPQKRRVLCKFHRTNTDVHGEKERDTDTRVAGRAHQRWKQDLGLEVDSRSRELSGTCTRLTQADTMSSTFTTPASEPANELFAPFHTAFTHCLPPVTHPMCILKKPFPPEA